MALQKVVESIMVQDCLPCEVLIADDGSGEETAQVINELSEGAPMPVLHVWQEHRHFRAAKIRNEAIKKSAGEYIVLLDGDCVVNRHFIADHALLAQKGCFVQGKRVLVGRDAVGAFDCIQANSISALLRLTLEGKLSNIHHLIRFPSFVSFTDRKLTGIKSCNMGFFRRDIEAINGFNEDFVGWGNEDSDLACRFFKFGLVKKTHPFMAICFHLWHPTNKIINNENKHLLLETIASSNYYCANGLYKQK